MDNRPIGIFDSGLGGLTAAKVMEDILPGENIVYFGDSGRNPYGGRSKEEITYLASGNTEFLRSFDVKVILMACGTTSSNSMEALKEKYDTPFFGVIDAPAERVASTTRCGKVGVIATEATIRSGAYTNAIHSFDKNIDITAVACPPFAPMVEQGHFQPGDEIAEETVRQQLEVFLGSGIDTLLLGCTHYPLLSEIIRDYLGDSVELVSCGAEAAKKLGAYLKANDMLSDSQQGQRLWYTSGDTAVFSSGAEIFLGHSVDCRKHIIT